MLFRATAFYNYKCWPLIPRGLSIFHFTLHLLCHIHVQTAFNIKPHSTCTRNVRQTLYFLCLSVCGVFRYHWLISAECAHMHNSNYSSSCALVANRSAATIFFFASVLCSRVGSTMHSLAQRIRYPGWIVCSQHGAWLSVECHRERVQSGEMCCSPSAGMRTWAKENENNIKRGGKRVLVHECL